MKARMPRQIQYFEVDSDFKLRLGPLFRLMQEAAVIHTNKAGFSPQTMLDTGCFWVAYKFGIEIHELPQYGQDLEIVTWCPWFKGFKTVRNFQVLNSDGRAIASASSLWLYLDIKQKKITKIPKSCSEDFTIEPDPALSYDIDKWKSAKNYELESSIVLTTRYADYDPLGHVNNTVYFNYLETLLKRCLMGNDQIRSINIEFQKEIDQQVEHLQAGLCRTEKGCNFKLFDDDRIFASGDVLLA